MSTPTSYILKQVYYIEKYILRSLYLGKEHLTYANKCNKFPFLRHSKLNLGYYLYKSSKYNNPLPLDTI